MHRSEAYDRSRCLECASEVSEALDRAFPVVDVGVLCFACAVRRGGTYDETHDHWDKLPTLEGLKIDGQAEVGAWK